MSTRCPRCFYLISADPRLAFECTCGDHVDAEASAYELGQPTTRGTITVTKPATAARPTSVRCSKCGAGAEREVCPICHYRLPKRWRDGQTTCIAMAGARASGKSFYIAVAVRELQQYCRSQGWPFDYCTPETRETYHDRYQKPLFEERRLIQATQGARFDQHHLRNPMIFNVGTVAGVPHRLVIRDVAGEDLERGDLDLYAFSVFPQADGIVFLFDPMGVEQIRAMLAGLVPDEARVGGDPHLVLSSLRHRMSQQTPLPTHVPIAVTLAKFDVMQQLRDVQSSPWWWIMRQHGAAILRDPHYTTHGYNDRDGRLLDAETRSLLHLLGGEAVVAGARSLSSVTRYFAVSSLGQHTKGERIHDRGISPFRCLEPIKWLLARRGVVPVV